MSINKPQYPYKVGNNNLEDTIHILFSAIYIYIHTHIVVIINKSKEY